MIPGGLNSGPPLTNRGLITIFDILREMVFYCVEGGVTEDYPAFGVDIVVTVAGSNLRGVARLMRAVRVRGVAGVRYHVRPCQHGETIQHTMRGSAL